MFGSLDGSTDDTGDWRDREAQLGLQLQQQAEAAAKAKQRTWGDTWNDIKGIPTNLLKTGGSMISQPQSFGSLDPNEAAMMPETFQSPLVTGPVNATASAIKSGVTAPGDALAGRIAPFDESGHTSPEMIQRGFDAAAMAGGASAAGTAGRVAADAARAGAPIAAAEHAPAFYSHLENSIQAGQPSATGAQWAGTLKNAGVKPDEMDWRGVGDYLTQNAGKPVTKDELAGVAAANPLEIRTIDKRALPQWTKLDSDRQYNIADRFDDLPGRTQEKYGDPQSWYEHMRENDPQQAFRDSPIYGDYKLPGADDTYRERLLTLPPRVDENGNITGHEIGGDNFRSNHWNDANVLVHRRSTDRIMDQMPIGDIENKLSEAYPATPLKSMASGMPAKAVHDGVLTPEEAADISRARGWRSGFEDKPGTGVKSLHAEEIQSDWHQAGRKNGYGQFDPTNPAQFDPTNQALPDRSKIPVPFAPFAKNWHELAAKDMLREAAEGDHGRVSWTAGEAQPTNPKNLGHGTQEQMDAADRGMQGFYNKMLPDYFNKVGKAHGVQVQEGKLGEHKIYQMDLPQSLKDQLLKKGMPLFEDSSAGTALDVASHIGDQNVAGSKAGLDVGKGVAGGAGGAGELGEAQRAAARHAGAYKPIAGLPEGPFPIGGKPYVAGPIGSVHDVAKQYMATTGRPYQRQAAYEAINPERAKNIAQAFEEMKHEPNNPAVKKSYDAMIKETRDQYDAAVKSGVKFEPIPADMKDPYAATPRLAAKDVQENNHLWYFPTDQGFGTSGQGGIDMASHPMMQKAGRNDIHGNEMLNNDLFRVVHDYFGHLKEGYGFRAAGEDNAWRTHAQMYSPEAKPAMTTETRGQNSWVNYGPHGETNRKASAADTKYADQKVGLLPDWVWKDEVGPPSKPAIGRGSLTDERGLPIQGPAYTKEARRAQDEIAAGPKGAGPLDLSSQSKVPNVPQEPLERYVPARGISPRMQDALSDPKIQRGIEKSMEAGRGVADWYHTEPLHQAFVAELGPKEGEAAFKKYMDMVAATSPRSDVGTNIRNASYYYAGGNPAEKNPYPYGHVAQNLHKQNIETISSAKGWDPLQNPKPASFAENLRGNLEPVTVDTHAFRNIGMRTDDPRFLETQVQMPYKGGGSEESMAARLGEVRPGKGVDQVAVFRPQQLVEKGKLSMKEAKKIPSFWAGKPKDNEYAAAEQLFRRAGNKVGMRPADAQAAAWSGAGPMTGLGTPGTHTFNELFNERVMFTARMRGEDPQKTLRDFITGRRPLLSDTSHGLAFGALDNSENR